MQGYSIPQTIIMSIIILIICLIANYRSKEMRTLKASCGKSRSWGKGSKGEAIFIDSTAAFLRRASGADFSSIIVMPASVPSEKSANVT